MPQTNSRYHSLPGGTDFVCPDTAHHRTGDQTHVKWPGLLQTQTPGSARKTILLPEISNNDCRCRRNSTQAKIQKSGRWPAVQDRKRPPNNCRRRIYEKHLHRRNTAVLQHPSRPNEHCRTKALTRSRKLHVPVMAIRQTIRTSRRDRPVADLQNPQAGPGFPGMDILRHQIRRKTVIVNGPLYLLANRQENYRQFHSTVLNQGEKTQNEQKTS